MSQDEFAELGGVKRSSQHLYERDARNPDAAYLSKIQAGGADVGYLFSGVPSLGAKNGVVLSIDQAIGAFRAVEDFAQKSDAVRMSAEERERLFKLFCTTLAADPVVHQLSEPQARAS